MRNIKYSYARGTYLRDIIILAKQHIIILAMRTLHYKYMQAFEAHIFPCMGHLALCSQVFASQINYAKSVARELLNDSVLNVEDYNIIYFFFLSSRT